MKAPAVGVVRALRSLLLCVPDGSRLVPVAEVGGPAGDVVFHDGDVVLTVARRRVELTHAVVERHLRERLTVLGGIAANSLNNSRLHVHVRDWRRHRLDRLCVRLGRLRRLVEHDRVRRGIPILVDAPITVVARHENRGVVVEPHVLQLTDVLGKHLQATADLTDRVGVIRADVVAVLVEIERIVATEQMDEAESTRLAVVGRGKLRRLELVVIGSVVHRVERALLHLPVVAFHLQRHAIVDLVGVEPEIRFERPR